MSCTIIVGGFFGDEGKGKIVAHIAFKDKPVIISRGGVGPNAGHTVQVGDREYGVRMVPSGFVYKDAKLCIGSGVLVDPRVLKHEVDTLGVKGRVFVDKRCGIITEDHIMHGIRGATTFQRRSEVPDQDAGLQILTGSCGSLRRQRMCPNLRNT